MKRICALAMLAALAFPILTGCHSKSQAPAATSDATPNPTAAQEAEPASVPTITSDAISSARKSLKAGDVDEAAARLAQLQVQRASFNAQQAKDYRQALSEAYDRAIEAAQRGDPKAQAALQLLRAAAPR